MDKEQVIKLRTALKGGKNIPLKIHIDNTLNEIDESSVGQFTLWDDNNGIIYIIKLPDMQDDYSPDNRSKNISIFAVFYENVQAMEISLLPLAEFDNVVGTIRESGKTINDNMVELIKNTYNSILRTNITDISHADYNKLLGSNLNIKDDYYNNRFTTNQDVVLREDRNKTHGLVSITFNDLYSDKAKTAINSMESDLNTEESIVKDEQESKESEHKFVEYLDTNNVNIN